MLFKKCKKNLECIPNHRSNPPVKRFAVFGFGIVWTVHSFMGLSSWSLATLSWVGTQVGLVHRNTIKAHNFLSVLFFPQSTVTFLSQYITFHEGDAATRTPLAEGQHKFNWSIFTVAPLDSHILHNWHGVRTRQDVFWKTIDFMGALGWNIAHMHA